MPIFDLFSTRKKLQAKSGTAEVYIYDQIPAPLRVQMQQILHAAIGEYYEYTGREFSNVNCNTDTWLELQKALCREYGVFRLTDRESAFEDIMRMIATTDDVDRIIDMFELSGKYLEHIAANQNQFTMEQLGITQGATDAIAELNYRFRAASVGYKYEAGQVVRIDSQYLHQEVVKPALTLLSARGFGGPQAEYLEAHKHYRAGENKDAIQWANKALESAMKVVCDQFGWPYDKTARASDLIKVLRRNQLWPDFLDGSFDQLIATLASGLPQLRNNAGGHGDGAQSKAIPSYIAGYALHLSAAKILLIVEAAKFKKGGRK